MHRAYCMQAPKLMMLFDISQRTITPTFDISRATQSQLLASPSLPPPMILYPVVEMARSAFGHLILLMPKAS